MTSQVPLISADAMSLHTDLISVSKGMGNGAEQHMTLCADSTGRILTVFRKPVYLEQQFYLQLLGKKTTRSQAAGGRGEAGFDSCR